MTVTLADKLERIPRYEAGMGIDEARRAFALQDVAKLASNESPLPPHPAVLEAIARAAPDAHRYPDPEARRLRRRLADRLDEQPGRIAVGNGSCEILLAAAAALCEPGDEVVFAWPSFSMYPHMAALSGAHARRVPLGEGWRHDLEAMADAIAPTTKLVVVCNPNNPTGTALPGAELAAFCERLPDHVTVVCDEAYAEFRTDQDPDATLELAAAHHNLVVLRTFSKCYGLAGLRVGYAVCSAKLRAAMDAVRQPFSVNALAQAAAAEALEHPDDVLERVERTVAERIGVEAALAARQVPHAPSQANFSWIELGDRDEQQVFRGLAERGVITRPGAALGAPGHLRVSYGTPPENERFIDALDAVWR